MMIGNTIFAEIKMTKEEYLELKEYLKKGIAYVEELQKQLPPSSNKLHIPSFVSPVEIHQATDEEIKCRKNHFDIFQKIGLQELDNELAAYLLLSYEVGKEIK